MGVDAGLLSGWASEPAHELGSKPSCSKSKLACPSCWSPEPAFLSEGLEAGLAELLEVAAGPPEPVGADTGPLEQLAPAGH